jgi:uncharacterized protein YqfA (UPF0365 family)
MTAVGFFSAVVILAVIFGFLFFLYYFLLGMWIRTIAAGVPLSIITLIRMRLMGIQPSVIVTNLVRARKAGLALTVDEMTVALFGRRPRREGDAGHDRGSACADSAGMAEGGGHRPGGA